MFNQEELIGHNQEFVIARLNSSLPSYEFIHKFPHGRHKVQCLIEPPVPFRQEFILILMKARGRAVSPLYIANSDHRRSSTPRLL